MIPRQWLQFAAFLVLFSAVSSIDNTVKPNANGADVVQTVINLIRQNCLFVEDKLLLRRLAYVLTTDGTNYRFVDKSGGIWGITPSMLSATQAHGGNLDNLHSIITSKFTIDWQTVTMEYMTRPLYSGLAAAMFIQSVGESVPWNIEGQAKFVTEHYNHNLNAHTFSISASYLDKGCHGDRELDLTFIIDDSTSLTTADFSRTKDFLISVTEAFNISSTATQVAAIKFDSSVHIAFHLNTYSTKASVQSAIRNLAYSSGSTDTADALSLATNDVFYPAAGGRQNAVKVAIVITDGNSNDKYNTQAAAKAMHAHGIVTFAIGVGDKVDVTELNTVGSDPACTHVYQLADYSQIKFIKEEIQQKSCDAPLYTNETVVCVAKDCPVVAFPVATNGLTVSTQVSCGEVAIYVSSTNMHPGPQSADTVQYVSHGSAEVIFVAFPGAEKPLFLAIDPMTSGGCTVSISPCSGDCTDHDDHSVHVYCEQDGHIRNCTEKDLKPFCGDNHVTDFPNPCTEEELKKGNDRFPFPNAIDKFIMCDLTGAAYVVYCPDRQYYVPLCRDCVSTDESSTITCNTSLPTEGQQGPNPCTIAHLANNEFFFPYVPDRTKFIHCTPWGQAFVQDCPAAEIWDDAVKTCVRVSTHNPCLQGVLVGNCDGPYANPDNPATFIVCDTSCTVPTEENCPMTLIWHDAIKTCDYAFNVPGAG